MCLVIYLFKLGRGGGREVFSVCSVVFEGMCSGLFG